MARDKKQISSRAEKLEADLLKKKIVEHLTKSPGKASRILSEWMRRPAEPRKKRPRQNVKKVA